jgi:hypothetical protein
VSQLSIKNTPTYTNNLTPSAAAIQQYFIELPLHGATATLEQAEYDFNATISSNERRTRMMNARSVLAAVRSVVMA